jgi:predicted membrane protein
MKNYIFVASIIIGIVVFALLINNKTKTEKTEEVNSEAISVKSSVKTAHTNIRFPAGILNISPSEKHKFFSSSFHSCNDFREPQINFNEEESKATLKISAREEQQNIKFNDSDTSSCTWNLNFNKKIENSFDISMIAGVGKIDLSECKLTSFDFKMTAGEIQLDLSNTSVPYVNFKAAAGEVEIDLSGEWKNDLRANIKGGVGEITVFVPNNIGVKIEISGILGEINAPTFKKKRKTYVNKMYGQTSETLYLDIFGGIGEINIKTVSE